MASYFADNDDLQYYFDRGIDWGPLIEATEHGLPSEGGFATVADAVAFYREIASMVGELAADRIAPEAATIDREGVRLENGEVVFPRTLAAIFDEIRALELHGMCLPRELGGMNAPLLSYLVNSEMLARADVSVMAHHGFHGGMAMAMLVFSMKEGTTRLDAGTGRVLETRFQREIGEIARGEAWGCMDITEPDAGSDMAQLRTSAVEDASGTWLVTGEKIFITSGHGKYHFVIARTEEARASDDPLAGLEGLSMFLVPTYHEDASGRRTRVVEITRVEEKLGHHGSATCALAFDGAPAHLIGRRGEGFKYMLTLMNNARLGVGFECIGLCEAALRMASSYAAERKSMGKTIDRHEMVADYLDEMHTDVRGLRALAMYGAWHEELSAKLQLRLDFGLIRDAAERSRTERRIARYKARARRVTPLLKYLGAEKAIEMSRRNLQIHGGNGYMQEFGAEKLLRDAMVMPIYEGTSQIQSLMAMKDSLSGIMKNPQAFVRRMAETRWRSLSSLDPLDRKLARVQLLSLGAQQHLVTRTAGDKLRALRDLPLGEWPRALVKNWDPKRDFAFAMLHAERLTRILADEAIGEVLKAQADRDPDRRPLLEAWLERAEPRCRFLHDEITTTGQRLLSTLAGPQGEAPPSSPAQAAE